MKNQKEKLIKEIVEIKWRIGTSEHQNPNDKDAHIIQLKNRLNDLISEIIKIEQYEHGYYR